MQVLNSIAKHYTKNEYFPKHILITAFYLLERQKLNHKKYYEQEINMGIFYKLLNMMCTCMQSLEN
jgi:hypothetical protein